MAVFNKGNANAAQTTIISAGTLIKGEMRLSCILHIDGNIEGDVISDSTVVIGKNGAARGSIKAKHIIINGKFFGNIEAELVELLGGGVLIGDVLSQSFGIEVGAKFNGKSAVNGGDQPLVVDGSVSEDVKLIDKALEELESHV